MYTKVTFRGMEHTPVLDQHVAKYTAKIEHFLKNEPSPVHIDVILEAHRTHHHHRVEMIVKSPHYSVVVNEEGPELYDLVVLAADIVLEQLHKEKKRISDAHRGRL